MWGINTKGNSVDTVKVQEKKQKEEAGRNIILRENL